MKDTFTIQKFSYMSMVNEKTQLFKKETIEEHTYFVLKSAVKGDQRKHLNSYLVNSLFLTFYEYEFLYSTRIFQNYGLQCFPL